MIDQREDFEAAVELDAGPVIEYDQDMSDDEHLERLADYADAHAEAASGGSLSAG